MLDRLAAPPFIQTKQFTLPPFQSSILKNGTPLFTIPGLQQEVIKVEFLFKAGRWFESQPALSHFTANMLEKGTKQKNGTTIAEAFDRLGAHIEISPGFDFVSISLYALKKNWKEGFSLLMEILREPAFDASELELMKNIFVENLKVNLEKSSFVSGQLIRRNIFGAKHPYGGILEGHEVQPLDPEALRKFHQSYFTPCAVFVTVPSGIEEQEMIRELENFPAASDEPFSKKDIQSGPLSEHRTKDEGVQTSIRLGTRSINRTDEGYFDLLIFNHILGGYFGSRLMKNIREEKGLTYGIFSSINSLRQESFLYIGADVSNENIQLAQDEIWKEIERMKSEPLDKEELEIAVNHFLGSIQLEVANPFSVSDKVKNLFIHQLPEDFYPNLFSSVSKVSAEDLLAAGDRHFKRAEFHTVSVG